MNIFRLIFTTTVTFVVNLYSAWAEQTTQQTTCSEKSPFQDQLSHLLSLGSEIVKI